MATQPPFMLIGETPVWSLPDGSYIALGGADVDGDGAGGNLENDPDFQPETTLGHADGTYFNSRTERGIVLPGPLMMAVGPRCIGCQARVLHIISRLVSAAVVYDRGPAAKFGEQSIALATFMGVNPNPVTGGTQEPLFLYQWWPGLPAVVNGTRYQLQPLA